MQYSQNLISATLSSKHQSCKSKSVTKEQWTDQVSLQVDSGLITRWFSKQATYRQAMEGQLGVQAIKALKESYQKRIGTKLRQTISHQHLVARR